LHGWDIGCPSCHSFRFPRRNFFWSVLRLSWKSSISTSSSSDMLMSLSRATSLSTSISVSCRQIVNCFFDGSRWLGIFWGFHCQNTQMLPQTTRWLSTYCQHLCTRYQVVFQKTILTANCIWFSSLPRSNRAKPEPCYPSFQRRCVPAHSGRSTTGRPTLCGVDMP
jgi:hypothetical protein